MGASPAMTIPLGCRPSTTRSRGRRFDARSLYPGLLPGRSRPGNGLPESGQLALDDNLNPAKMACRRGGGPVNIPLDRDKPTALPRQIQAHLERLIHERLLTPGMKLPATRELARQLGVNRGTVALAYEELVATGWARAHVGQGTFVAERPVSGAAPAVQVAVQPVALDWSGLFSRSAQILGADDERSRAVTPIPSSGAVVAFRC